MMQEPSSTTTLCGSSAAPPICHGSLPAKGGRLWKFLSKTTAASPRIRIDAPIVMMISVTAEAPARRLDREPMQQQADRDRDDDGEDRGERQRKRRRPPQTPSPSRPA